MKQQKPVLRVVTGGSAPDPAIEAALLERAAGYKLAARSENTRLAYERDWTHFSAWCKGQGYVALPAEPVTLDLYLVAHAETLKPSTLARRLVAISRVHQAAGYEPATRDKDVRETYQGICREQGTAPKRAAPLMVDDLRPILDAAPDTMLGTRDCALLLVGLAGGFRASELVGLTVADVRFVPAGMVVLLRRSKTDQKGEGREIAIGNGKAESTCPVRALRAWLAAASIKKGAIFRSVNRHGKVSPGALTRSRVGNVLRRAADRADLPTVGYSAHSIRAGFATSAAKGGASERSIMKTTGHKSEKMVRGYIRDAKLFQDNAGDALGL